MRRPNAAGAETASSSSSQGRKRKRSVSVDSGEGSASDSDSSHSDGEKDEDEEKEEEEEDGESSTLEFQRLDDFRTRQINQLAFLFLERRKERGKEREKEAPPKPRPLHLTTSLFIRSIPPEVSKEEITAVSETTRMLPLVSEHRSVC